MKAKLTKGVVEAVPVSDKVTIVWDTQIPGFGVKVDPKGRRTYILKYRDALKIQRKPNLGIHGIITCEQAREQAKKILAQVAMGDDPLARRRELQKSPTFAEFAARFVAEYASKRLKPRSLAECERVLKNVILPKMGQLKLVEIDTPTIAKLHRDLHATKPQANRVLAAISKMLSVANEWGLRSDPVNPARSVKKYPETPRDRFLSEKEVQRLFETLAMPEFAISQFSAFVKLAIYTGCRKSELLNARWQDVDLTKGTLRLHDSKTGARNVLLNEGAVEALRSIVVRKGQQYVISSRKLDAPAGGVQKWWQRVRTEAGLKKVRIHDLRHTFASMAAGSNQSLLQIGALLGHKSSQTTMRYAHHYEGALRVSTDAVSKRIRASIDTSDTD